jgi:hypothetical protein
VKWEEDWVMSSDSPEEARRYLAGLALANEFEIEELRGASIELKLRHLWALNACDVRSQDRVDEERRGPLTAAPPRPLVLNRRS